MRNRKGRCMWWMRYRDGEVFMGLDYGDEAWSTTSHYVLEYHVDKDFGYGKLHAVPFHRNPQAYETLGM